MIYFLENIMGGIELGISVLFIIAFVYLIAISSMGVECYNENPAFAKTKDRNKGFLDWSVGITTFFLVLSLAFFGFNVYFMVKSS